MKKWTALFLAMLLACGSLPGCNKDVPKEEIAPKENTTIETTAKETETDPHVSQTTETESDKNRAEYGDLLAKYTEHDLSQQGFSIKGKGYYYKGHPEDYMYGYSAGDVLLFDVTNETDYNYTVLLTVTYYDENGKGVDIDLKKFKQFAAGYQRYFLFTPRKDFEYYTCEFSVTEYTEEIYYLDTFSHEILEPFERRDTIWERVVENNDFTEYPTIMTQLVTKERPHSETLRISSRVIIIFDNTGEIFLIAKRKNDKFFPTEGQKESYDAIALYQTTEKKLAWPEELKGELNLIVITDEIKGE